MLCIIFFVLRYAKFKNFNMISNMGYDVMATYFKHFFFNFIRDVILKVEDTDAKIVVPMQNKIITNSCRAAGQQHRSSNTVIGNR